MAFKPFPWLQKSEREKLHSGKTKKHPPTQTPCNQPESHTRLDSAQTRHPTSIATSSAPYTRLITTSALCVVHTICVMAPVS